VNDDKRRRAYGSQSDAYRVFEKMFLSGHPPEDWDQLLAEAGSDLRQLSELFSNLTP
jgi:toxin YhaV